VGIALTLALLFVAAQTLVHLYASSAVAAAAYDAARLASGSRPLAPADAVAHGRAVLGSFAGHVEVFTVTVDDDTVRARVVASSPALLPRVFGHVAGLDTIDRSVTVRRERLVCADC
jgi:hypothetical protein